MQIRHWAYSTMQARPPAGFRMENQRLAAHSTGEERILMPTLIQDLRYALRMMRKSPTFTTVAVLTLALGIGANTAIFTVVNAVLLQPLPYPDPERVVYLNEGNALSSISYPNYLDWAAQNHVFEHIGATQRTGFVLTGHGEPKLISGAFISAGFLPSLGVKPQFGRVFFPADDHSNSTPVAVISYKFWQRLGGDQKILGSTLRLDQGNYTVAGILPAEFKFLFDEEPQILVPIGLFENTRENQDRARHGGIYAVARLKPGFSIRDAQADLDLISARLARAYPAVDYEKQATVQSLFEVTVAGIRSWLLLLLGAVGLVLLIAGANVANLLLARAASRQSEMAVRVALGASNARLFRQALTESTCLSLFGGILGLLLASAGVRALLSVAPDALIRVHEIHLNGRVTLFTLLVSFLTGIIFGLVPAWHISRFRGPLQHAANRTHSKGRQRTKNTLVVGELALSLVMLAGAGLLVQSFIHIVRLDTGFKNHGIVTASIGLPLNEYKTQRELDAFFDRVIEKLEHAPGVDSAAVTVPLEFSGVNWGYAFLVEGDPFPAPHEEKFTRLHYITPEYLDTMKIPLVRGRNFNHSDNDSSPPVALVTKSFVDAWLQGKDPIGVRVRLGKARDLASDQNPWFTIVGVVNDVRHYGEQWLEGELLIPFNQHQRYHVPFTGRSLVIRSQGDPVLTVQQLRRAVTELDPNQSIENVITMDELISRSMTSERTLTFLITIFAVVALALAIIGIYGVLSYWVSQRTKEVGIRLALGASQINILKVVLWEGGRLALAGLTIGLPFAFGLGRLLPNLSFAYENPNPLTLIAISIFLGVAALLACYIPARRAAKVDPMVALRYE